MSCDFSPYQAVLLDLDGTIYHEHQPLPGAVELVKRLQHEGRNFACLSNSSASPLRVMARLEEMGVDLDPNNIYTAAAAACDYVLEHYPAPISAQEHAVMAGAATAGDSSAGTSEASGSSAGSNNRRMPRVFNLATESVDDMLQGMVEWVHAGGQECDAVIVGPPSSVFATEPRQRTALELARRGAAIVGICADRIYPSPRGVRIWIGVTHVDARLCCRR